MCDILRQESPANLVEFFVGIFLQNDMARYGAAAPGQGRGFPDKKKSKMCLQDGSKQKVYPLVSIVVRARCAADHVGANSSGD